MSSSTTIGLKLKHPQMVYYSGQHIEGTVTIKLKEQNQAIDLIIRFVGKSSCRYPHKSTHGPNIEMENEHTLVEHGKIVSSPAPGKHDMDFQFDVPNDIPGSVDLEFGSIFYELIAKYGDSIVSRPVTVVALNNCKETNIANIEATDECFPNELMSREANVEKDKAIQNDKSSTSTIGCQSVVNSCFGMVKGNVGANMHLTRGSHSPGEGIVVVVDAYNNLNVNTQKLRLSLVQTIKYVTNKHTKITTTTVASVSGPKVQKNGGSVRWQSDPLRIPFVAPTTRDEVISVEYNVRLKIIVNLCSGVELIHPVVISGIRNWNVIGGRRGLRKQLQTVEMRF